MSSNAPASRAPSTAPARYKRRFKNYLIDSRFQLKYTGMILFVTLVISGLLGGFLWRTSHAVVVQSQKVAAESRKVSDLVRMNIAKDPVYSEVPELQRSFTEEAAAQDRQIEEQQLELLRQQKTMMTGLFGGLAVMVILIGMLGIYFTHKVAGPIYKIKTLLKQVGDGRLRFEGRLRKGDELQDFFGAFLTMVDKLRDRQQKEVDGLTTALDQAEKRGIARADLVGIELVRDSMKAMLDAPNPSEPPGGAPPSTTRW